MERRKIQKDEEEGKSYLYRLTEWHQKSSQKKVTIESESSSLHLSLPVIIIHSLLNCIIIKISFKDEDKGG